MHERAQRIGDSKLLAGLAQASSCVEGTWEQGQRLPLEWVGCRVVGATGDGSLHALRGSFVLACRKEKATRQLIYCSYFHLDFSSWSPYTPETCNQQPPAKDLSYVWNQCCFTTWSFLFWLNSPASLTFPHGTSYPSYRLSFLSCQSFWTISSFPTSFKEMQ